MIEIKTALKRDFSMIEEFFKENQLNLKNEFNHSSNYVIVLEEKKILGISEILDFKENHNRIKEKEIERVRKEIKKKQCDK